MRARALFLVVSLLTTAAAQQPSTDTVVTTWMKAAGGTAVKTDACDASFTTRKSMLLRADGAEKAVVIRSSVFAIASDAKTAAARTESAAGTAGLVAAGGGTLSARGSEAGQRFYATVIPDPKNKAAALACVTSETHPVATKPAPPTVLPAASAPVPAAPTPAGPATTASTCTVAVDTRPAGKLERAMTAYVLDEAGAVLWPVGALAASASEENILHTYVRGDDGLAALGKLAGVVRASALRPPRGTKAAYLADAVLSGDDLTAFRTHGAECRVVFVVN